MSLEAGDGKRTNIYGDSDKGATREEEKEVNEVFQEKDEINFESLKSLENDGIDMSFLGNLQEQYKHRGLGSSRDTKSDNGKASSSGRKVIPAPNDDKEDTLEKTEGNDNDEVQNKGSLARPNKRKREMDDKAYNGSLMVMKKKQREEKVERVEVLNERVGKNNSNVGKSKKVSDKEVKHAKGISSNESHAYNCDKCSFKGKNKNGLNVHKRLIHKIKHKCDECEFEADVLRYVTLHQSTHATEPQFECPICFEKYQHDTSLTRHKRSAHGPDGNNTCEKCRQTFKLKQNLRVHLGRVHNEGSFKKKEYRCDSCNYVTDRRGCLTKHIEKYHKK